MGMKACSGCMRILSADRFHGSAHYGTQSQCIECQRDHNRRFALANLDSVQRWQRKYGASSKGRANRQRRRARRLNAYVTDIKPFVIFERDKWRCGICRKSVSRKLRHPHPRSASIDHIIPLNSGGMHEPANVQLAHLGCNSGKRDRGGGEQLLLIG